MEPGDTVEREIVGPAGEKEVEAGSAWQPWQRDGRYNHGESKALPGDY